MISIKSNKKEGLTPVTSSWMERIFSRGKLLSQLMDIYGSPINILHMPLFEKNIDEFQSLFDSFNIDYKIYYARKANKCKAFVSQAKISGIGVDTASEQELAEAISLGIPVEDLVLTSAIKTRSQIELAVEHNVTIILDNEDECRLVNKIAHEMGRRATVGIRISGFSVNNKKLYSRFGFDIDRSVSFVTEYIGPSNMYDRLDLRGLHYHLDGYSITQRSIALLQTIDVAKQLKSERYPIRFIDIGGGILVKYLQFKEEWESFKARLIDSLTLKTPPITFQNNGLGYQVIEGKLTGELKTYPYFNETSSKTFIQKILQFEDSGGNSLAQILKTEQLQIRIEPGRSLVDQCGITVARVVHRKQDLNGEWLVGLEMNMSQMMSSSPDFLLDPYIIYQNKPDTSSEVDVFFTGAYCLERDILLKRKIRLPSLPDFGDLVVFVNTAGYMMHFFETEAHRFSLAENLVLQGELHNLSVKKFIPDDKTGK